MLCSCNAKYIYSYEDEAIKSTYRFYKKNRYHYTEKNSAGEISIKGHYTKKDSILTVDYPIDKGFPVTYQYQAQLIYTEKQSQDSLTITIQGLNNKSPLLFANLALYDSSGKLINGYETDFDGMIRIPHSIKVDQFTFSYVDHAPVDFHFDINTITA